MQRSPWLTRLCSAGRRHVCARTPPAMHTRAHTHTHTHACTHTHTAVIKDMGMVFGVWREVSQDGGPGPAKTVFVALGSVVTEEGGLPQWPLPRSLHPLSCFSVTSLQRQKLVSGPWVLCRSPWGLVAWKAKALGNVTTEWKHCDFCPRAGELPCGNLRAGGQSAPRSGSHPGRAQRAARDPSGCRPGGAVVLKQQDNCM